MFSDIYHNFANCMKLRGIVFLTFLKLIGTMLLSSKGSRLLPEMSSSKVLGQKNISIGFFLAPFLLSCRKAIAENVCYS